MNSCQNIKLLKHTNTYSHSHLAFPSHSNPLQYSFFNALASPFSLSILISIYLSFTYPLLIFHQNRTHTSLLLLYKVYIILTYFNHSHPYKKTSFLKYPSISSLPHPCYLSYPYSHLHPISKTQTFIVHIISQNLSQPSSIQPQSTCCPQTKHSPLQSFHLYSSTPLTIHLS